MKPVLNTAHWNLGRTIQDIYQPRRNAFDMLRFVLASLVIVFHSYVLSGSGRGDFLASLTHGQSNLGEFSVSGFFVISGFLITQSLLNSSTLGKYFWKRFLRLLPALIASLGVSALILGPFITGQSPKEYFFGSQGVSPWRNIFLNATLNIFGFSYSIRDLFAHNPYPYAVNGSLWTLKHEFASYVLLAVLGYLGIFKRSRLLLVFTGLIGLSYVLLRVFHISLVSQLTTTWWIFHEVEFPFFLQYFWMFLLGSILFVFRQRIPVNAPLFLLFFGLLVFSVPVGQYHYAWMLLAPYLIIVTAISLPLSWFSKYGDFSYGIYVYAFPIQQTLMYLLYPHIGPNRLMLYSFLLTLMVSVLSWHFIEKPALALKNLSWGIPWGRKAVPAPDVPMEAADAKDGSLSSEPVEQIGPS